MELKGFLQALIGTTNADRWGVGLDDCWKSSPARQIAGRKTRKDSKSFWNVYSLWLGTHSSWCHVIFPFVRVKQPLCFLASFRFSPAPISGCSPGVIYVCNGGIISSQSWCALTSNWWCQLMREGEQEGPGVMAPLTAVLSLGPGLSWATANRFPGPCILFHSQLGKMIIVFCILYDISNLHFSKIFLPHPK